MKQQPSRGRPPLDDESASVSVHLKMPAAQYDDTYRRAQRERKSVQDVIRADVRAGAAKKKET